MIGAMTEVIILGEGDAAAAALDEAAAQGIPAMRPAWPVWSVVPGFRVDALGPDGTIAMQAPRVLAVAGVRPVPFGGGTIPEWHAPRLLRAAMTFDGTGWTPLRDANGQTSVPGLFVAETAAQARSAIRRLLLPLPPQQAQGEGSDMRMTPSQKGNIVPAMPSDMVICPCEGLTRAHVEAAVADGARDMNQLRAFTRCGMGPCQGQQCEELAARILAPLVGGRVAAGQWTMRPPLFPVPLDLLMGAYTYADIPVPAPAPL